MATPAPKDIMDEVSAKAPEGTVLPPRNVRELIEKTAGYVVRNGKVFEERVINNQGKSGKTSFVLPDDAYYNYYQWRLSEIREGRGNAVSAGRQGEAGAGESGSNFKGREERKGPEKPEEFQFSARMPNISAQDLEVVKLTALYVAKNGRGWMTALSQREAGNYQFDFLRPQHSLYGFFSRIVDQYTDLLNGDSVDDGRPQKKRITELEANVQDRFRVLEKAKKRAEYVRFVEAQKVKEEEQKEKDRVAYAQVDWHDFVIVETVVFDAADDEEELPRPTTLNDLQSATLEQKAKMSINPDRRIEEAMPDFDSYEQFGLAPQPASAQTPQPTPQPPPRQLAQDDEATRASTLQADRARARAAQEAARSHPTQPKIRHDYVPAAQARKQTAATSICPNCHQAIPNSEMENHMRIEMLDPQWRDQNRIAQQRSSTTNLSTADVARNLKRLASQRGDVFDPVTGREVVSEEERERRKRAELGAYDGVSTMPNPQALAGMGGQGGWAGAQQGGMGGQGQGGATTGGQGQTTDVQEQIRLIREKAARGG